MRQTILRLAVTLLSPITLLGAQAPTVRVDPRIELTTIVFRLIGASEYSRCAIPTYAADIDRAFAAHRSHPTLKLAERLREAHGIGFDAVPMLSIGLSDPPALAPRVRLGEREGGLEDRRWLGPHAAEFASALNEFARDTRFTEFFEAHRTLYDSTEARLRAFIEREIDLPMIAAFFGEAPTSRFFAVPGMCNGGANYGPRVQPTGGVEERYAILGMAAIDSTGLPVMDVSDLPTVVHEFTHSYVNPVVERQLAAFAGSGPRLFADSLVRRMMAEQAYGSWETLVKETLVRASVIRYLRKAKGDSAAAAELREQYGGGFVWMHAVDQALKRYESARDRYPRFADFMPELGATFTRAADSLPAMLEAFELARPQVTGSEPSAGATGVSAADTTITIRFDRPMRRGYSFGRGPGGEKTWPAARAPTWSIDRTAITFRVTLAASMRYELRLPGAGFRAEASGVPMRDFLVTFDTGAK